MKRFLLMTVVLLLPAMSFGEPNFTGTWVRDGAKSDVVPNTMYWLTRGVEAGGGRGRNAPWCSTESLTRCRRKPGSRPPPSWRRSRARR